MNRRTIADMLQKNFGWQNQNIGLCEHKIC